MVLRHSDADDRGLYLLDMRRDGEPHGPRAVMEAGVGDAEDLPRLDFAGDVYAFHGR